VLVVYDSPGWTFHRIAEQILKYLSDEFEIETVGYHQVHQWPKKERVFSVDAVILLAYQGILLKQECRFPPGCKIIVCCYDDNVWRSESDQEKLLREALSNCDMALFANDRHRQVILRDTEIIPPRIELCEDGVDTEFFDATEHIIVPGAGPDWVTGPLIVGWAGNSSGQFHGGDNKGFKLIQEACKDLPGVKLSIMDRDAHWRSMMEMRYWYRELHLILCASAKEGTPNPILEAASSGRGFVSTEVGIIPDLINRWDGISPGKFFRRDLAMLRDCLTVLANNRDVVATMGRSAAKAVRQSWRWDQKVEQFRFALRQVLPRLTHKALPVEITSQPQSLYDQAIEGLGPVVSPGTDLSQQVTCFVLTVGEPDTLECLTAIKMQDCILEASTVIANIAPMNMAFQQMLDQCQTPFFVQIDADMILKPYAIRHLHGAIMRCPDRFPIVCYGLYDGLFQRNILGVKIYRHSTVQNYPYQKSESCEMDQAERMKVDGYQILVDWRNEKGAIIELDVSHPKILGIHGRKWTPEAVYERMMRLFVKYRLYPWMGWLGQENWPRKFYERAMQNHDGQALWAFLGIVAGLTCDLAAIKGEKDFRRYEDLPGLKDFKKFFEGTKHV